MVHTSRWVLGVATFDGATGAVLGWLIGRGTLPWWALGPWFVACVVVGWWLGGRAARRQFRVANR